MSDIKIIDLTPENIADYGVCGYKDVEKHLELRKKIEWFKEYYPKGLRIKAILSDTYGYQGMLEYIPGKYAHRPVDAEGYMFIHCIFVGFKKEFKGKGHASLLLDGCINDAKKNNMLGVAVVTRKGPFMARVERDRFFSSCRLSKLMKNPQKITIRIWGNHFPEIYRYYFHPAKCVIYDVFG